ncbi:MAG: CAP domain-containing protein [Prochlorothrix sp.]
MTVRLPNGTRLSTFEGVSAVDEAIEALQDLDAVPPLTGSEALSLAAQDHVQAQGPTGAMGHEGARGGMQERIERHGDWQVTIGENISYGAESGADVVRQLLIDDGVPGRGHRLNLLNPKFRVMGTDCGPHLNYGVMCVMTYAGGYQGAEAEGEGESAGATAMVDGTAGGTSGEASGGSSAAIDSPDGTAPDPSSTSASESTTHQFVVQHRGTLPLVSLKLNDIELLPEALPAGETLSLALESCQGDLLLEIDGYATLPWRNLDLCRFKTLIIDSNNSMRLGLKR